MVDKKAFPIVLSGASGVGKTAVGRLVLDAMSSLVESVSFTTREPRRGEEDGIDYHFITEKEFLAKVDGGEFIEWAKVHDRYYGTSIETIDKTIQSGSNVFTILDVQGGLQLKKNYSSDTCLIWLMPPSMAELERRLRKRGSDDEETIQLRVENATKEHDMGLNHYDYFITNSQLETTLADVLACIRSHGLRKHKYNSETIKEFIWPKKFLVRK